MKILGLDTTRKKARLFVYNDSREEKEIHIALDENIKHSEGVFLYLEKLLNQARLTIADFDYYSAIVGPGSFTGIRVGMSIAKAFNMCNNKTLIGINTFDLLKKDVKNGYILLNCTTSACYYAKVHNKAIVETGVVEKANISQLVGDESVYVLAEEQNLISLEYNKLVVIDNIEQKYVPTILDMIEQKEYSFEPYYIQLSQAERNLKNE